MLKPAVQADEAQSLEGQWEQQGCMEIVKRKIILFLCLYFSVLNNPSNAQFQELVLAAADSDLLLPHE